MKDKINDGAINQESILGVSKADLDGLNDEQKSLLLTSAAEMKAKGSDAGYFGKFFGTNIHNAAIHIAFVICLILLLFCGADLVFSILCDKYVSNREMWDAILPIITLALGYIFGSGQKE